LCRKVKVSVDQRAQALFPENMAGMVRIRTKSGEFETLVKIPLGEPDNFLGADAFKAKFDGLAEPYLGRDQCDKLADALMQLEQAPSLGAVMALSRT
ncbi:MAG: hypothetical protein VW338_02780, partial [Rhodospirillaceae bacterium]